MNILYFHQYFKTPQEPGGTRSYWIAKELIGRGHKVTIITASSQFTKQVHETIVDGINVIYIQESYNQEMGFYRRLKAFCRFMYKSTKIGLKYSDVDLVIATSTPLTIGVPALMLKWLKKVPYIFEVRDLWPEVPIQMGAIKNPLLIKVTKFFEKIIYQNATHVVSLSPGMRDGVIKYIPYEKTSMIPNMAKKDEFWPREKNYKLMKELGLNQDSFKIIHFGALGLANGIESVIETAELLKNDFTIEFVFLGGGAMESRIKEKIELLSLKNVKLLGRYPMRETSEIVNFCDVSLVSFLNLPILSTNSPNKLFDSLSAGKPIIVNSAGWTKDLVEDYVCGFYVNFDAPSDLVEKIKFLQKNTHIQLSMGEQSRSLALNKFDKTILCKEFGDIVEKIESQKYSLNYKN
ncbi:glycosyltransferase family 4 protein [Flavobacterium alkalisoli]|uniref:Glycosyltransferase family 4 protein n=1 Tax=Flavobacterium alkalisoli TaxID=2602769 RepID=A0A5B9FTE1_9FLAO|nr:glycosyltransferase family 4 protein [Flavobacterium alkalisoli]QEE49461.1 glycosyltransferase family 4 protein [Flavobacterium alkalisoli]